MSEFLNYKGFFSSILFYFKLSLKYTLHVTYFKVPTLTDVFTTDLEATTHTAPPTTTEIHNHNLACVVSVIWAILAS